MLTKGFRLTFFLDQLFLGMEKLNSKNYFISRHITYRLPCKLVKAPMNFNMHANGYFRNFLNQTIVSVHYEVNTLKA